MAKVTVSMAINFTELSKKIDNKVNRIIDKAVQAFIYTGEAFVKNARQSKKYKDQTGNLTASIGYIVVLNGKIVSNSFKNESSGMGAKKGEELAKRVMGSSNKGLMLIGVAGMNYGIIVESKGFDVISQEVPNTKKMLKNLIAQIDKN